MNYLRIVPGTIKAITTSLMLGIISCVLSTGIFANPVLDNIAAGQITVQQSPNSTVINQTTQKGIVNWQSFNIGASETTHFQQPVDGMTLNRINPSQGVSQIFGRLTATGKIILVNPAGLFFGPSSFVNVGGLIATTSQISDQDFLNSFYHFTNDGRYNGAIVNQGQIIAASNGLIALIGGSVSNEGMIQAHVGYVVLAAGNAFTMTFAGNDLISFTVDSGVQQRALDQNGQPLRNGVNNTGNIYANGGQILISARDASGVLDNVINMQGIAVVKSIYTESGQIILSGDSTGGAIRVGGSLNASSDSAFSGGTILVKGYNLQIDDGASFDVSSAVGNGGFLETSGTHGLHIGRITLNTSAPNGLAGTWLIDPADLIITSINSNVSGTSPFQPTASAATLDVNTLIAALGSGNVIVQTTNDGFAGNGDITVAAPITWTSANTLTLMAYRNIYLNADITALNGGLNLNATYAGGAITTPNSALTSITSGSAGLSSATGVTANINVKNYSLERGVWYQLNPSLPQFNVSNSFTLSNDANILTGLQSQFMRALGGTGTTGNPFQLTDIYGVQGINASDASSLLTKSYILANDIDATGTATWNSGAGFHPIGFYNQYYAGNEFTGTFNGNNHAINGLHINRSQYEVSFQGEMGSALFASVGTATIRNLGLTNVDITSINSRAAGIAAFAGADVAAGTTFAQFNNNYVTGNITSNGFIAGAIVAYMGTGIVTNVHSNATVNSTNNAGGLVGYNFGIINGNSYFTGNVVGSGSNVGGIVGYNFGTISNVYSSGTASGLSNVGGIAGNMVSGSITNAYNTGTVTASTGSAGGIAGTINNTSLNRIYNTGTVRNNGTQSSPTGFGGIVGTSGTNSVITNAYNSGFINGNVGGQNGNGVGGIIGNATFNASSTIGFLYNIGNVVGISNTGGLIGRVVSGTPIFSGTSYWNSDTSGQSVGVSNFSNANIIGANSTTMQLASTYSSWNTASIWSIISGVSYPYLQVFYTVAPRIITAISGAAGGSETNLYVNATLQDSVTTGSNGSVYFLEGLNNISGINHTIADNSLLFLDFNNAAIVANAVAVAPTGGGQMGIGNGLTLIDKTVTAGLETTASALNNSSLATALGALSGSNILYSVAGNNLLLNPNTSFVTTTPTTYTLNGNITAASANITLKGHVVVNTANAVLTTTTLGSITINNNVDGANNALTISNADASIISGDMGNLINFTKSGSGILTLTGTNSYTGTTNISAGTLQVGNAGVSGTLGAGAVSNNGALAFNRTNSLDVGNDISGIGSLLQSGSGTTILSGNNSYSGGTTINSGTLQIGNGSTTGNLGTGLITNQGNLVFNLTTTTTVDDVITGTGSLTQLGTGTTILTSNNNYSGGTTISGGTLQLGNGGATGAITDAILDNAALIVNRNNNFTLSNTISGTGSLTFAGPGTVTLSGNNSYQGITNINAGNIIVTHGNALGDITNGTILMNGASLTINGVNVGAESLALNGGTFAGVGAAGFAGDISLNVDANISNNSGTFTLSGALNGNSHVGLIGAGTTVLNGSVDVGSIIATAALSIGGGGIATTGSQFYANTVALTSDAMFSSSGIATQVIAFNSTITGNRNIALMGTGLGTYNFTVNSIAANNIQITAAPGASNSSLTLNSGGAQTFRLSSNNNGTIDHIGSVTGAFGFTNIHNLIGGSGSISTLQGANVANIWNISTINGGSVTSLGGTFANMQNLIGGTETDYFTFANGMRITGTVDGGDSVGDRNYIDVVSFPGSLILTLTMPAPPVIDSGIVRTTSSAQIVSFSRINGAYGNGEGYIILPDAPNIKITGDPTNPNNPKYGYIADPFYYNNWILGNPPAPSNPQTNNNTTNIAAIVNQPIINSENNDVNGQSSNYTLINQTLVTPLLNTTSVETGGACYPAQ